MFSQSDHEAQCILVFLRPSSSDLSARMKNVSYEACNLMYRLKDENIFLIWLTSTWFRALDATTRNVLISKLLVSRGVLNRYFLLSFAGKEVKLPRYNKVMNLFLPPSY